MVTVRIEAHYAVSPLLSYILHTLILYTDICNIIFFVNCTIMHGSTNIQFKRLRVADKDSVLYKRGTV